MYGKLAEYMQWRVDLLMADRFEDLARGFVLPFALYRDDQQIVLPNPEELMQVFAQVRQDQRQRGVMRVEARMTAVDLPRQGRFRVWLTYVELDAQGRAVAQSDAILYCRETPDGPKCEMAEYGHCLLPGIWTEFKDKRAVQ